MSQLIHLRQRIAAIKKTSKITRAMRLMSMSLYSKAERHKGVVSRHRQKINDLFEQLNKYTSPWRNPHLFPGDILNTKPLIIIVSSGKGLCGGFNTSLVRYIESGFVIEPHQQPSFIAIG